MKKWIVSVEFLLERETAEEAWIAVNEGLTTEIIAQLPEEMRDIYTGEPEELPDDEDTDDPTEHLRYKC